MKLLSKAVWVLGVAALLPSLEAGAAAFVCRGKVVSIGHNPSVSPAVLTVKIVGSVASESSGHVYYCATDTNFNGVPLAQCKYVYSMFQAAFLSGKTMTIYFEPTASDPQNCAAMGDWAAVSPIPYHYSIED